MMKAAVAIGLAGIPLSKYGPIISEAEKSGAYALCVGEAAHETFAAASFVSALTTKPRIISGIATWARPPVTTALAASTVDEISGGRYELGLGTMPEHWNRDHYGIDPARPLVRMREYVEVIRLAWKAHGGFSCDFAGEFYNVAGYRRMIPPLRDEIPIHLAATRPGMARLSGEISDGVLVNWLHTQEWLHEVLEPAFAEGVARGSRSPQRSAMVRVLVEPDPVKARDLLRPSFAMYQQVPYFHEVAASGGFVGADLADGLVDAMTVHGDLDSVVSQLQERYGKWADWLELTPPGVVGGSVLATAYQELFRVVARLNSAP